VWALSSEEGFGNYLLLDVKAISPVTATAFLDPSLLFCDANQLQVLVLGLLSEIIDDLLWIRTLIFVGVVHDHAKDFLG
jgi:hypothetical protein